HLLEEIVGPALLPDAAAPEISLLAMRADPGNADAGRADDHRLVRGMAARGELELVLGGRRAAIGSDLAVRPGLFRDPLKRVPSIFIGAVEHARLAFREIAAAFVLLDDGVAFAEKLRLERRHLGLVGRADQH